MEAFQLFTNPRELTEEQKHSFLDKDNIGPAFAHAIKSVKALGPGTVFDHENVAVGLEYNCLGWAIGEAVYEYFEDTLEEAERQCERDHRPYL